MVEGASERLGGILIERRKSESFRLGEEEWSKLEGLSLRNIDSH